MASNSMLMAWLLYKPLGGLPASLSQHRAHMSISTADILLLCPACDRLAHSKPELHFLGPDKNYGWNIPSWKGRGAHPGY